MNPVELIPLPGMPEVRPGDDLAGLIASAAAMADIILTDGDVIAIAQKIVSKAGSRFLDRKRESTVAPPSTMKRSR